MSAVSGSDLHNYFAIYQQFELGGDPVVVGELDQRLSEYKDLFHRNADEALKLLSESRDDFVGQYEDAYRDLVFDLKIHAKSMEAIKKTHTYDAERDVWVPK
jgi:hypothetical protein